LSGSRDPGASTPAPRVSQPPAAVDPSGATQRLESDPATGSPGASGAANAPTATQRLGPGIAGGTPFGATARIAQDEARTASHAATLRSEGGAPPSAAVPRIVAERYEILGELGRGGMGAVYRARDLRLDREVALKVLFFHERVGEDEVRRFEQEARAAGALRHPGIVQVYDVGEFDGKPFFTMERVGGEDLAHELARGTLAPREAVEIVLQVAEALDHAHGHGVLHRDVKPRNVLIERGPAGLRVRLADFGLAKFLEHDVHMPAEPARESSLRTLTRTGELVGTPAYMSPEQVRAGAVDARTDLYSLGATLYEMLTGADPFHDAPTLSDLLARIRDEDPVPPRRIVPDLDADLETICLTCLQKEPRLRYASAAALAEDCRRWRSGEPIAARPIGAAERLWRKARRNPAAAISAAALALVLVAFVAVAVAGSWRLRREVAAAVAIAEGALSRGDFAGAVAAAERAAELAPADAAARALLARARAESHAARGEQAYRAYREARERAAKAHAAHREAVTALDRVSDPAGRERSWTLGARAREEDQSVEEGFAAAVGAFTEALAHWAQHPSARRRLADLYGDRLREAEERRDRAATAAYRGLVLAFGGDALIDLLEGVREARVRFLLPGGHDRPLEVRLYRFAPIDVPPVLAAAPCDPRTGARVADPAPWEAAPLPLAQASGEAAAQARAQGLFRADPLCATALPVSPDPATGLPCAVFRAVLPRGSWVLDVPGGQGVVPARYPFTIDHDRGWDDECALPAADDVPPPLGANGPDEWSFVPAGPYRAGDDPEARVNVTRPVNGRVRVPQSGVDGFSLARGPVTVAMYREYLNDREYHDQGRAFLRAPRTSPTPTIGGTAYVRWHPDGRLTLSADWRDDWPILGVSAPDADDYCKWLTWRHGAEAGWTFFLPTEDEWEKAARGADGRFHPWGDDFDPSFCCMIESRAGERAQVGAEPWGLFPVDESPYGVRDLAGGATEWTATPAGAQGQWRILKGGAMGDHSRGCRSASRAVFNATHVAMHVGFRIAAQRGR